jgi:hypothetical protein
MANVFTPVCRKWDQTALNSVPSSKDSRTSTAGLGFACGRSAINSPSSSPATACHSMIPRSSRCMLANDVLFLGDQSPNRVEKLSHRLPPPGPLPGIVPGCSTVAGPHDCIERNAATGQPTSWTLLPCCVAAIVACAGASRWMLVCFPRSVTERNRDDRVDLA